MQHKGDTDTVTTVALPSAIDRVGWNRSRAAPGAHVGLDVRTRFVGNGAQVQVQLRDASGTPHRTFTEGITAGRVRANIPVPADARDALVADVTLPQHGLQASSPPLLLTPPVTVRDAMWRADGAEAREARRGDVLTLTAAVDGAPDGLEAEITVFEHDADGAHDLVTRFPALVRNQKVETEWLFEYHEDTDDIPADDEMETGYQHPEYFFRVDVGGVRAESGRLPFQDWIEFFIRDPLGSVLPNWTCAVRFPDGDTRRATTDAHGVLRLDNIPPGPCTVDLYPDD